jgi:hypothetical protein
MTAVCTAYATHHSCRPFIPDALRPSLLPHGMAAAGAHTTAFCRAASRNLAEAVHPVEVVLGAPEEVPVDWHAFGRGALQLPEGTRA